MSRIRFRPKPVVDKDQEPTRREKAVVEETVAVKPAVQGGSDGASFALTPTEPQTPEKKGRRKKAQ